MFVSGDDFGYNPSSPAEGRRAAISAIEEWWKEQSRTEESPEPGR